MKKILSASSAMAADKHYFISGLRAIVSAADELLACKDLDCVYYRAVELGREIIGLDRTGIMVNSHLRLKGTYGTDSRGNTIDEHDHSISHPGPWQDALRNRKPGTPAWVRYEGDHVEWRHDKLVKIGTGWSVCTPIECGNAVHALYFNDNAISNRPCNEVEQEILAVFCSLLGRIIEQKKHEKSLKQRDAILQAMQYTAERFLASAGWEDNIQEGLAVLGRATQVSRTYLFKKEEAGSGAQICRYWREWCDDGSESLIGNRRFAVFAITEKFFQPRYACFQKNEPYCGYAATFTPAERLVLGAHSITSFVCVPIYVGGEWWGYIGLDECRDEREWSRIEIDALKTAAKIFGAAVQSSMATSKLRESEALYAALFEQATDAILLEDSERRIINANRVACQLFGRTREEIISSTRSMLYDTDSMPDAVYEAAESGVCGPFETVTRRSDGTPIILEVSTAPLRTAGTTVFLSIIRDITEQKQMHDKLQRERNIFIGGPVIVFEVKAGQSGTVDYVSRNITQFGYTPEQFLTAERTYGSIVHQDDAGAVESWIAQLQAGTARTSELSYRVCRADGSLRWVNDYTVVIRDSRGTVNRLLRYLVDITDMKRMETELIQARDTAEAGLRARSQFLANMSHEIRTPLNAIIGFAQLVREKETDETKCQYLDIIHTAGKDLLVIINDILDFSKIEAGRLELSYEPFNVIETMRELVASLQLQARDKNLTVRIELAPDLPDIIIADSVRFRQIVLNLVNNAIKFTEKGGVVLSGELVETQQPHQKSVLLRFTIKDTGIGIPAERQKHIFDYFTQADSSYTRKHEGTGLGLSICKRLTELLGGTISCESIPGEGSTFRFEMPADLPGVLSKYPRPAPVTRAQRARTGASEESLRILVAEDKSTNQLIAKKLLEKMGHQVDLAANGRDVLKQLDGNCYDLILMDVFMPEMDGFEATLRIRTMQADTGEHMPIIAMTAHAMQGDRETCINAGMDDYITKPINEEALRTILEQWCY